ncbi:MAG: NAD-dependent epimerase/dehydratase family protein [Spirochaetales bacterium]
MKILILGGTGVISRAIVERLLQENREVVLFNRGIKKVPFSKDVRVIVGDRFVEGGLEQALGKETFDAVIDMICFNPKDAEETLRVFTERSRHIIITSSIAAYKRPYHTLPTQEDAEELFDNPVFPYAFNKAEMERYIWKEVANRNLPVTVVRPSLTYGVGATNIGVLRQNYGILYRIRNGKPLVMFGDGSTPWQFTFVEDLAKVYAGLVGNPKTFGQAYHATTDEIHRWEDLYLEFGRIVGKDPQIVHVPSELLMQAAPSLCSHLFFEKTYPGVFDNAKIKGVIPNFKAEVSFQDGLAKIAEWFDREASEVDPAKDTLEDQIVEFYEEFSRKMKDLMP